MSLAKPGGLIGRAAMSTPTVTEITRQPEPVAHDTFIDDILVAQRPEAHADATTAPAVHQPAPTR